MANSRGENKVVFITFKYNTRTVPSSNIAVVQSKLND
jgi:hypothetical protein